MIIAFVGSLDNPLGQAWVIALRSLGIEVVVHQPDVPPGGLHEPFDVGSLKVRKWQADDVCEAVVLWWGYKALRYKLPPALQALPRILIVDTLPDASRPQAEVRELMTVAMRSASVVGMVFPSEHARWRLTRLLPNLRRRTNLVIPTPFTLAAASRDARGSLQGPRPRAVFTGRPDHLWTTDVRMKKDAMGATLREVEASGWSVVVPSLVPQRAGGHRFDSYPNFTVPQHLNGDLATFVGQFDANLVLYNVHNATIRRRVRSGLSTRLALALIAGAPVVAPKESAFLKDLWGTKPFGLLTDDPAVDMRRLTDADEAAAMRRNWREVWPSIAFEANSAGLEELLGR